MGAGHRVTALYEVALAGSRPQAGNVDKLKYQKSAPTRQGRKSGEILTVKVRYKLPDAEESRLMSSAVEFRGQEVESASQDFRLAAAVAEFGMLLRDSPHKGRASYEQVLALAGGSMEASSELPNLVRAAQSLSLR